ncbi:fibrinogen-like protein 1 isoform X3 [Ambystoma mexicanum]|uniref:fibrinogen-like protein 1 isoform X3 n=1 Tax=Ambystoma mexicanum TaxID=8296 RepID=UPI0037E9484A
MKTLTLFTFILSTVQFMGFGSLTLESCLQEQLRLQAQVRLLEHRIKQQHMKVQGLLEEMEMHLIKISNENSVIDLSEEKRQYADCAEIYNNGHRRSGFYKMKPLQSRSAFQAFCDMSEGGGWTVFQRRSDGSQPFDRAWAEYKYGFGDFTSGNGEFWLGNDNLHFLTSQERLIRCKIIPLGTASDPNSKGNYTLRIDLVDFEGNRRFAQYKRFRVGDEEVSCCQPERLLLQRPVHSKDRQWHCLVYLAWMVVFLEICHHEG